MTICILLYDREEGALSIRTDNSPKGWFSTSTPDLIERAKSFIRRDDVNRNNSQEYISDTLDFWKDEIESGQIEYFEVNTEEELVSYLEDILLIEELKK